VSEAEATEVATEEVVVSENPDDDDEDVEVEATEGVGELERMQKSTAVAADRVILIKGSYNKE